MLHNVPQDQTLQGNFFQLSGHTHTLDHCEAEISTYHSTPDTNSEKLFPHQISKIPHCSTLPQSTVNGMLNNETLD